MANKMKIFVDYKNKSVKESHSLLLMIEKDREYLHIMLTYDGRDFNRLKNQSQNFILTQRLRNHLLCYPEIVRMRENFRDFYYKFEEMID